MGLLPAEPVLLDDVPDLVQEDLDVMDLLAASAGGGAGEKVGGAGKKSGTDKQGRWERQAGRESGRGRQGKWEGQAGKVRGAGREGGI